MPLSLLLLLLALTFPEARAAIVATPDSGGSGAFVLKNSVSLPVTPEAAYDAMTGDISGWWDHSFSDHPYRLFIEPKPGGGFYEIFDSTGDGALHATVILAERGKMLRFSGPLGLSGKAVDIVHTWEYTATDSGCTVTCSMHLSGEVDAHLAAIGDAVWHHFLVEQLKPYIESGRYLTKSKR